MTPAAQLSRPHELSPEERRLYDRLDPARIPQHIAVIMDGNGRWAGKRRLQRFFGHSQGAESVRYVTETAARVGVPWLTLYAFSLENRLRRPKAEVNFLMRLLRSYLVDNIDRMKENNIRLAYIGRTLELPSDVQATMQWALDQTGHNTGTTLTLALNYGSRGEIVDAVRACLREQSAVHQGSGVNPAQAVEAAAEGITEESIGRHLYTAHMPDPDLVIRTSGEVRVSNFLLWQIAYAEIFVTDRMWPDFRGIHLLEAMEEYQRRERRFGGVGTPEAEAVERAIPVATTR